MDGINGKVVAITGAGTGIGAATALALAARGAKLVLGARRIDRLDEVAARIAATGGDCVVLGTDVRRRDDLTALVTLATERYGRLDVLVSNAGIGPISPLDGLRMDDWDDMIDINVKGLLHGIAAALPVFRRQHDGHFVNIISTAGLKILPNMAVYAATKNAARTITEGLRQEAGADLRVTGISPGFVRTEFADSMTDPVILAQMTARMGDIAIPPEAIARAVVFAVEQPATVDVGDIVIRPTAQS